MSSFLFELAKLRMLDFTIVIHVDGVVREVSGRILGRGLILVNVNDSVWKLNHLVFADDTALLAASEKMLC